MVVFLERRSTEQRQVRVHLQAVTQVLSRTLKGSLRLIPKGGKNMIITDTLFTFERNSFKVKAVRITPRNVQEIAEWTAGEIVQPEKGARYVRIPCGSKKENRKAYVGDWVTNLVTYNDGQAPEEPNFRVYNHQDFTHAFHPVTSETEKFAKVHDLLLKLALAQDRATYHGDSSGEMVHLVETTAREICNII
jgi:hypothetical protein